MKITTKTAITVNGRDVDAGKEAEVSDAFGAQLIAHGYAVPSDLAPVIETAEAAPAAERAEAPHAKKKR